MSLLLDRSPALREAFEPSAPKGFWKQFEQSFGQRANEAFVNDLHPLTVMGWRIKHPDDSWAQVLDRSNRGAQSAFVDTIEYSLRDASAALPFFGGLESGKDWFSDLFLDSLDAVEEESVSPLDTVYRAVERLWWQSLSENRVFRYGLRPFETDPYAFLSLRLMEANRLILMGHLRYYFENLADHRFEVALALPLTHGIMVDIGTAYQFGQHEVEKRLVVKVFKPLRCGGILHLGIEVQKFPTLLAGISLPM